MPNRMLRDWTASEKMKDLSVYAERLFTRLIMKADDYGCFWASSALLRSNLFPFKVDSIREADVTRWTTECQKAGLIIIYEHNKRKYLQIVDFGQRLDKSRPKFPLPSSTEFPEVVNQFPEVVNDFPAETESETKTELEMETEDRTPPSGAGEAVAPPLDLKKVFENLVKDKKSISNFIKAHIPDFPEPYVELWNIFAAEKCLAAVSKITDTRRKKMKVRLAEKGFDFLGILKKANASEFLLTNKWFSFDWIFENETNYVRILEGNYDKGNAAPKVAETIVTVTDADIGFMLGRFRESKLERSLIKDEHYAFLKAKNLVEISDSNMIAARAQRIKNLNGTNKAEELRILQDYLNGINSGSIKADVPNLLRIAKRFAVLSYFQRVVDEEVHYQHG